MGKYIIRLCTAAFVCASVFVPHLAAAQASLSLSYSLAGPPAAVPLKTAAMPRCDGLNWVASIAACGREWVSTLAERVSVAPAVVARTAREAAEIDLPELGDAPPEPRSLRAGGGREALLGKSGTADVLVRIGSRYRFRNAEEGGWEYYRFTDTTYQTHLHNKGHKALGLELLVPFH